MMFHATRTRLPWLIAIATALLSLGIAAVSRLIQSVWSVGDVAGRHSAGSWISER